LSPVIKTANLKPSLVPLFGPLSDCGLLKKRKNTHEIRISFARFHIYLCLSSYSYHFVAIVYYVFCTIINF